MGYRERLVRLPKDRTAEYQIIESYESLMAISNVDNEDEFCYSFTSLKDGKELLYLSTEMPEKEGLVFDLFPLFDINAYSGHRYQIVTKEGLKFLIEKYENEIIEMFDNTLAKEEECQGLCHSQLHQKRQHWRMNDFRILKPYTLKEEGKDLDDNDGQITPLPFMEYQIFNLVFIYNTFDWSEYNLVVAGW